MDTMGRAVAEMTETRVTAEQELAKNSDLKKEDLAKLHEWAATQLQLPKISEEQMILFFHSCYWDIENTKSCIEVYYSTRSNTPEFFSNRDVAKPNLKQALQVLYYSALPVKDPNGYQIVYHGLQQFEASKYVFADGVKMLSMAIDACAMVEGTVPGYIFLFNMKGVRLTHLTRLSVGLLRKFFVYIQEGLPVRLQAIHVVNTMPIVDKIMFMIKPFMKKELLNMLHFHYGDYSEVQKFIPKECLPKDLDGDLKTVDELHDSRDVWAILIRGHARKVSLRMPLNDFLDYFDALIQNKIADFCEWMARMTPQFLEEEIYRGESSKDKSNKKPENDLSLSNLSFD